VQYPNRLSITVAAENPDLGASLARDIVARWPGAIAPEIAVAAPDTLLAADEPGAEGPRPDAAVALVGSRAGAAAISAALRDRHIPGILLSHDSAHIRDLQHDGILVEPTTAPPERLAAELYAMLERQPEIDALRRDVRLMTLSQGGARGELDRIHSELNMAALVQQESLPKALPEAAGLDFAVLFRPCGYVSGDIYDLARLDERTVAFFIADAVGHGVPAALLTMVITKSLRTTDVGEHGRRIIPPGEALARLNDEMIRAQRGDARFATAIYGIIDEPTRRVTLACAGHPAPLILGGAAPRAIEPDGPLLGVFRNEVYKETSFTLGVDEALLLYSDGFETAFPDAGADAKKFRRGNSNYLQRLAALPWPGADGEVTLADTFAELVLVLNEQAGSLHQVDDVTALAISPRRMVAAMAA
jgi:sigma-B regulation protein RsbU (phosphoserine phosphatase)